MEGTESNGLEKDKCGRRRKEGLKKDVGKEKNEGPKKMIMRD
jgi:hypothetical protein